jgi:lipopolysaccharide export LptBFGC system permease protein LptF
MEKNMNSDYSHNPLTEVALALSMAFFAIMVLTIFALSQKQFKSIESDKISMNSKSSVDKDKKDKKRTLVFYHNNNFYDQNLKIWRLENQDKQTNRYILAVPTKMSVKELFEIKKIFQGLDLQVTEQNHQWNEALENISTK